MNLLNRLGQFISYASGYDAVSSTNKRKRPAPLLRREDDELRPQARKQLLASTQHIHRNFSVARWAMARHLDYVSTFSFQAKSGNKDRDLALERLVKNWSQRKNFEVTERFTRQQFVRLAELHRTLNGDLGVMKLRSMKVQGIESDLIRTPNGGLPQGYDQSDFLHGVRTNKYGKHLEYCICKRGRSNDITPSLSRYEFDKMVPARNLYHFSYFDRFDQIRGISPFACAYNSLADCYEGIDYALAKMKVSQIFGLAFYREKYDDDPPTEDSEMGDGGTMPEQTEPKYGRLKFGSGPMQLNLDPGDRAEFLESHTPSSEFQAFTQTTIAIALKALDIPFSFFSEDFTNYSGARQAMLQYEQSAKIKRQDVKELLDHLTTWQLVNWIQAGCLPGACFTDFRWQWVPTGQPWIDPLKERQAQVIALGAGLTSRQREALADGGDFFDIADELAEEQEYLKAKGLDPTINPGNVTINEVAGK